MTNNTSVFDTILRNGIGLDPAFFANINQSNFPPHTIAQKNSDEYRLILAVAGYSEDNIEITQHNDILTIVGHRMAEPENYEVLYGGIAFRDFHRQFKIGEHVSVESATMKDGLLQIDLIRRLPEILKPKKIALNKSYHDSALKIAS